MKLVIVDEQTRGEGEARARFEHRQLLISNNKVYRRQLLISNNDVYRRQLRV